MRVAFEIFKSSYESWETLFNRAAAFAAQVGPQSLIGISHSHEGSWGVVTVWYWAEDEAAEAAPGASPDRA